MATLLIIVFSWLGISALFCLALARAAGRPTPAPEDEIVPADPSPNFQTTSLRPASTPKHSVPSKAETTAREPVVSEP
jgi:hypothetical protein